MLNTFLEKAESLINRTFVVGYWIPTFLAAMLALAPSAQVLTLNGLLAWWLAWIRGEDNTGQAWLLLILFLAVTLIAYLLQAFTRPLVQLFEGYGIWGHRPMRKLNRRLTQHHRTRLEALEQQATSGTAAERALAQDLLVHTYPSDPNDVLPTRLGNTIKAAEGYGRQAYGMDMPFWWPRLWSLLPEEERGLVQEALTGLVSLLNLSVLLACVGIGDAVYLLRAGMGWQKAWTAAYLLGAWLVAWLCYEGAIVQARAYGQRLRASVDLHRFKLFAALHISLPKTPLDERQTWTWLTEWLYDGALGPAFGKRYEHGEQKSE